LVAAGLHAGVGTVVGNCAIVVIGFRARCEEYDYWGALLLLLSLVAGC
jgi:hypothetical protein